MTQYEAEKYAEKMRKLPDIKKTIVVRILDWVEIGSRQDEDNYDVQIHMK